MPKINRSALRKNLAAILETPPVLERSRTDSSDEIAARYAPPEELQSPPPKTDLAVEEVDIHTVASGYQIPLVDSKISTEVVEVDSKISTLEKVDSHKKNNSYPQIDRHRNKNLSGKFIRLEKELLNKIRVFCAEQGIDQQEFFALAAIHYFERVDIHKKGSVDIKIALDDLMILYKTDEDIISLYRKYLPLRKWTSRDDAAAKQFNSTDRRIIEYAMLQCFARKGDMKINSFKYFVDEIRYIASLHPGDEHIEAALVSLKRYLNNREQGQKT